MQSAYNVGCFAVSGFTRPVFTGPFVVNNSKCFQLSNGVSTLGITKKGVFTDGCPELISNFHEISVTAFPNPFITSFFIKNKTAVLLLNNSSVKLELLDVWGRILSVYTTDFNSLNHGIEIKLPDAPAGIYLLKMIAGNTNLQSLKLIKSE